MTNQMKEQARLRQAASSKAAPTTPTKPTRGTSAKSLPAPTSADELRARFEKVILAEGYSSEARDGILDQHFDCKLAEILRDVPKFERMLAEYESRQSRCPLTGSQGATGPTGPTGATGSTKENNG
jgi:hypothetical protein